MNQDYQIQRKKYYVHYELFTNTEVKLVFIQFMQQYFQHFIVPNSSLPVLNMTLFNQICQDITTVYNNKVVPSQNIFKLPSCSEALIDQLFEDLNGLPLPQCATLYVEPEMFEDALQECIDKATIKINGGEDSGSSREEEEESLFLDDCYAAPFVSALRDECKEEMIKQIQSQSFLQAAPERRQEYLFYVSKNVLHTLISQAQNITLKQFQIEDIFATPEYKSMFFPLFLKELYAFTAKTNEGRWHMYKEWLEWVLYTIEDSINHTIAFNKFKRYSKVDYGLYEFA